jgi:hypothetical protein
LNKNYFITNFKTLGGKKNNKMEQLKELGDFIHNSKIGIKIVFVDVSHTETDRGNTYGSRICQIGIRWISYM